MNENKMPNLSFVIILLAVMPMTAFAQEESNFPEHLLGIYQPNDRALDFQNRHRKTDGRLFDPSTASQA